MSTPTATEIILRREQYWREQLPKIEALLKPLIERQSAIVAKMLKEQR